MKTLEEENSSLIASNEEYRKRLANLTKKNEELKKKIAENDKISAYFKDEIVILNLSLFWDQ